MKTHLAYECTHEEYIKNLNEFKQAIDNTATGLLRSCLSDSISKERYELAAYIKETIEKRQVENNSADAINYAIAGILNNTEPVYKHSCTAKLKDESMFSRFESTLEIDDNTSKSIRCLTYPCIWGRMNFIDGTKSYFMASKNINSHDAICYFERGWLRDKGEAANSTFIEFYHYGHGWVTGAEHDNIIKNNKL